MANLVNCVSFSLSLISDSRGKSVIYMVCVHRQEQEAVEWHTYVVKNTTTVHVETIVIQTE